MATNELLPFANGEDANVLPTAQWQALTDILENGFQSGIARSEQVNRVLAQGAVASYVLGQLIVDQLNKDATLDKSALYQNLILALQENAKDVCLPLTGGTVDGSLTVNGSIYNPFAIEFRGDDGGHNGGYLDFHFDKSGKDYTSRIIEDADGQINLISPNGLKVNNKQIITVVESWSSGTSWYRKYSDGWIEQGGICNRADGVVTFPTAFQTKCYGILDGRYLGSNQSVNFGTAPGAYSITKTGFKFNDVEGPVSYPIYWRAEGY